MIYVRLDDEQTERQLMAGRLNMLYRDRRTHARIALLMKREARMSREAWGRSMDASDLVRSEVMSLRTMVLAQQPVITELQAADRRRQAAITELLATDRKRQAQFVEAQKLLKRLQTQMTEFERQQGPAKARDADRNTNGDDSHISGAVLEGQNELPMNKLEMEIWDLKVKGIDLTSYTQRFQELALFCGRMFPKESDKIEKYVNSLPDMIHGSRVKGSLRTPQGTLRTNNNNNNNNNNRTRGRTLVGPTLQDLVRRSHTGDLNPYAQNETITAMVHVLLNATNATKLAILPVIVKVQQMLTMLTTKRALGRVRSLLAMSVEFRDILRGNV
ncbi:hypothetical protein Tco_1398742 [Tanacetum coccineum]